MGVLYELRHVAEEDAVAYLQSPALFVRVERARQEEARKHRLTVPSQDWDSWKALTAIDTERCYSWKLLLGLISVSEEAFDLVVHGGQPIGGLEESWQLEASVEVLRSAQVAYLYASLAAAPVEPAVESYEIEAARLFQDLLHFLQSAAEKGKALLVFQLP